MIIGYIQTRIITWYLYALVNPLSGEEFYVGLTIDPKERLPHHISRSRSNNLKQSACGYYIRALTEMGVKPEMKIIEVMQTTSCSDDSYRAYDREKELIREYKKQGKAWTNDRRIR